MGSCLRLGYLNYKRDVQCASGFATNNLTPLIVLVRASLSSTLPCLWSCEVWTRALLPLRPVGRGPSLSTILLELLLLDEPHEAALCVDWGVIRKEVVDCLRSPKPSLALLPTCREKGFPVCAWGSDVATKGTCSGSLVIDRGTEYADEATEDLEPVEFE